jgi:hypothetical protein
VHRTERLITSSAWANLEMHAYYLRLKRGLSGSCTLVMYWDTVYTRSTHGLRVTLGRITPEEPPPHSNSLTRLTPRRTRHMPGRSRAQAARQQPRPVVDLRRPVHAPPVFIGMNMGANSWSMNASVCVTTSTPPPTRTRLAAWFPARHDRRRSGVGPICAATQEFASGVHSFNSSRHRGIMILT